MSTSNLITNQTGSVYYDYYEYQLGADIIIIIMKSSIDRDNNYSHYVILRNTGFAITLNYHPAECDVIMVVYRLLCGLLVFFSVSVCDLGWWVGGSQVGGGSIVQ